MMKKKDIQSSFHLNKQGKMDEMRDSAIFFCPKLSNARRLPVILRYFMQYSSHKISPKYFLIIKLWIIFPAFARVAGQNIP